MPNPLHIKGRKRWVAVIGTVALLLFVQAAVLVKNAAIRKNHSVWSELELRIQQAHDDRIHLLSPSEIADLLVHTIIQIESGGNPQLVGSVGERGLMQIKLGTWADMTARKYGAPISFDRAFDPKRNEEVGRLYLDFLQQFLNAHRNEWNADERALLLACYNAGPGRVQRANFDLHRLPSVVQDYVQRGTALHDQLLADQANHVRHMLISFTDQSATDGETASLWLR